MSDLEVSLQVNGVPTRTRVDSRATLLDLLRDRLGLTGAKRSCDEQVCGACTVLLDGDPVSACGVLAGDVSGRSVATIEGGGEAVAIVQQAFMEASGLQCGFCTPGMVLTVTALLEEEPDPDDEALREGLSGNLCRCTGYHSIFRAVRIAADRLAECRDGP